MTSLLTVIGTRPQFIKYAAMSSLLREAYDEVLVDTGQHYDHALAASFVREFALPEPDHTLRCDADAPALQLAQMLVQLHGIITLRKPAALLCFGDTTSTLAAALAAVKCGVPVVHIEGGERNFTADEMRIPSASTPEESNRIAVDHLSSLLVTASQRAFSNLIAESVTAPVYFAGDIMYDLYLRNRDEAVASSDALDRHGLEPGSFIYCTVHRALNTDSAERLAAIFDAMCESPLPVIVPLHPRTAKMLRAHGLMARYESESRILFTDPVGWGDSVALGSAAHTVVTDSGGVMREAYFGGVPSVCVDDSTAWLDIVLSGWSVLAGADAQAILNGIGRGRPDVHPDFFGSGDAARRTVDAMRRVFP